MSRVTNVILAHHPCEDDLGEDNGDVYTVVKSLNQKIKDRFDQRFGPEIGPADQDASPCLTGGLKFFEHPTYLAAFNHIDVDELKRMFAEEKWKFPGDAQLMVCDQDEDSYTVYTALQLRQRLSAEKR